MKKKLCSKCGAENQLTRYFCNSCGAFLDSNAYNKSVYELPQMKIMRIVDNLRHMKHGQPVPDEAFEPYAEKMERLQAIFALPEFIHNKSVIEEMKAFLDMCRHPDFQIAFVGTIKTGKSTLINALLGKNYASMAVTPETAALTKFRVSPQDYVNITFYSEKEWDELWASRHHADRFMEEYNALDAESQKEKWIGHIPLHKNLTSDEVERELTKWSSSKSAEHYFVKEIEVGISTLAKDFPSQVVFVDTPGIHKAKNKLGEYMVGAAEKTINEVDVVCFIVEPTTYIGAGEQHIIEKLKKVNAPKILVINKVDTVKKEEILPVIDCYNKELAELEFDEIIPVSARNGSNVDDLVTTIFKYLTYGPMFYDEDTVTDQPLRQIVAELIREKALHALNEEIPHGIAVVIDTFKDRKSPKGKITDIDATIICERDSHKGIIIGKGGEMLKKIGTNARYEIEKQLGNKVNLKLWVKVKKEWRDSDILIKNFGYDKKDNKTQN